MAKMITRTITTNYKYGIFKYENDKMHVVDEIDSPVELKGRALKALVKERGYDKNHKTFEIDRDEVLLGCTEEEFKAIARPMNSDEVEATA